ncbi:MAG: hypothetical protein DRQ98_13825 [Gammaproteobacteria bacterium]|nr:MAG: hypothetical protein DRQ98_13825 [Gammaproteobacteria bacterium]
MDIGSLTSTVKAVVVGQLALASDDPAVDVAGESILAALGPALTQMGTALAEQAAAEVGAQLTDHAIDVVLRDGEPYLVVRSTDETVTISHDDLGARITVRLPEDLKGDLESAASDTGDSVNTFVVRAIAGKTKARSRRSRTTFKGTIET